MDDDIRTLLRDGVGGAVTPIEGPDIRARAERGRRRQGIAAIALVAALLTVPAIVLLARPTAPTVLIDQPTTAPTADEANRVYDHRLEVTASVEGELAAALHATLLDPGDPALPIGPPARAVVLAATEAMVLDLSPNPGTAMGGAAVRHLEGTRVVVEEEQAALTPGRPVLLTLPIQERDPSPDPATEVLTATAADGRTARLAIRLTTVEITATDLDLPPSADVPDQRLPRPPVGEAIPTRLEDGTPVWVVGLDDGEVSVVDARSTHRPSGLVGWCATLPGFIDSPGSSRFTSLGGYAFGPAPAGLPTYDVEVEPDHVLVTARRAPEPRSAMAGTGDLGPLPQIEQAPPTAPRACEISPPPGDGPWVEDYTDDPAWVQHDLGDWPRFDGQPDGWYRAEEGPAIVHPDVLDPPTVVGDLLLHRVGGVTVDAVSPPGASQIVPSDPPSPAPARDLVILTGIEDGPTDDCPDHMCPYGSVRLLDVIWVTPTGVEPVTSAQPPVTGAVLTPTRSEPRSHNLAEQAVVDATPGDLVVLDQDPERGSLRAVTAAGRPQQ